MHSLDLNTKVLALKPSPEGEEGEKGDRGTKGPRGPSLQSKQSMAFFYTRSLTPILNTYSVPFQTIKYQKIGVLELSPSTNSVIYLYEPGRYEMTFQWTSHTTKTQFMISITNTKGVKRFIGQPNMVDNTDAISAFDADIWTSHIYDQIQLTKEDVVLDVLPSAQVSIMSLQDCEIEAYSVFIRNLGE
ncbi:MAG: hypothetical protein Sylvanvirus1_37 [Sylvanvirus sp.]|uniref:Uncharacterized protein n=1 Tax=Sylvanvirus sp. TaxID=2487774 RepID=A0A3G5AJC4_9VIRU|nr:MAG: hypothetical protein Sylvanvirus1_37 [Sylvanvirus sp.]